MSEVSGQEAATPNKYEGFVLNDEAPQVKAPAEAVKPADPAPTKEAQGDQDDADDETTDHSEGKKRRRGGFQKKIARLEAEIAALRAGQQPKADSPAKAENATDAKPDPDKYTDALKYQEDLAEWKAKQVYQDAEKSKQETAKKEADTAKLKAKVDKYNETLAKTVADLPDFNDVVSEAFDEVPINPAIREALLETDLGPEVVYYLAKNADEFAALNKPEIGLVQVMKAFGRIEAKIESAKQVQGDQKAAVKTTNAPPPIKPVTKGKSGTSEITGDESFEDFVKKRNAQRKNR